MKVAAGSYVLASKQHKGEDKPKVYFLKVENVSPDLVSGTLETPTVHLNPQRVSFTHDDILADLGKKPLPGRVYGFDTKSLYRGEKSFTSEFPNFHVFDIPAKEHREELANDLVAMRGLLSKHKLEFLLEDLVWELTPKQGKYAGMFLRAKNLKVSPDRIQLVVNEETKQIQKKFGFRYVLAHELGHKMHLRYAHPDIYPKLNARWLNLYQTSIERHQVGKDLCKLLLKQLVKAETFFSFMRGITEDEKKAMKMVLREIHIEHNLTKSDIAILHATGDPELLSAVWPAKDVFGARSNPILTEYATKNYKELVAETFSFWILGMKTPDYLSELMEKTVSQAKRTKINNDAESKAS